MTPTIGVTHVSERAGTYLSGLYTGMYSRRVRECGIGLRVRACDEDRAGTPATNRG